MANRVKRLIRFYPEFQMEKQQGAVLVSPQILAIDWYHPWALHPHHLKAHCIKRGGKIIKSARRKCSAGTRAYFCWPFKAVWSKLADWQLTKFDKTLTAELTEMSQIMQNKVINRRRFLKSSSVLLALPSWVEMVLGLCLLRTINFDAICWNGERLARCSRPMLLAN